MVLVEFKNKYNQKLATMKRAETFFDNPAEPMECKEKWLPKFQKITNEFSLMMKEYREITEDRLWELIYAKLQPLIDIPWLIFGVGPRYRSGA